VAISSKCAPDRKALGTAFEEIAMLRHLPVA
jgi:hypothetical protein